jgi:hypothetical protein
MAEIVPNSLEGRSSASSSFTNGTSCRDSELVCTQVVESSSEYEGIATSRGGCSEFSDEI